MLHAICGRGMALNYTQTTHTLQYFIFIFVYLYAYKKSVCMWVSLAFFMVFSSNCCCHFSPFNMSEFFFCFFFCWTFKRCWRFSVVRLRLLLNISWFIYVPTFYVFTPVLLCFFFFGVLQKFNIILCGLVGTNVKLQRRVRREKELQYEYEKYKKINVVAENVATADTLICHFEII